MDFNTIVNKYPNIQKALLVSKERRYNFIQMLNKDEKIKFVLECNKYCLKNYKKIFENKKVAIIGPSPSIRNEENGEYIEKNYDIIVRVNKQWKFDSKLEKYIGKRTDVLYNCIDQTNDCGGIIDINYLKRTGVKLIVDPIKLDYFNPTARDCLFHSSYRLNNYVFFHLNNQYIVNFGMVNKDLYEKWDKESDTRINTGMLCIIDILHSNAKEVYVKGFSFFKDGYLSNYRNIIFGNKCTEKSSSKIVLNVMQKKGNHDQEKQWIYLKKILENKEIKERFNADTVLDKILKLKNFNDDIHNNNIVDENIRDNPEKEIENVVNYLDNLIYKTNKDRYGTILLNHSNFYKFIYDSSNKFSKNIQKKDRTKYNNIKFKDITMVLCLKNRPKRFTLFYNLNKSFLEKYNINLIIVEGKSDNMINTSIINNVDYISHYVVDIKNVWSRAVLLNYGVSKCKTKTVILSDIDFIYTKSFWDNILDLLNHTDLNKTFIGTAVYESENTYDDQNNNSLIRHKYMPYGSCYIISKYIFVTSGGFDTRMIGFGWEERELQTRLKKYGVDTIYTNLVYPYCYVIHYSHNQKLRGKLNFNNEKLLKQSNISKIEFKTHL